LSVQQIRRKATIPRSACDLGCGFSFGQTTGQRTGYEYGRVCHRRNTGGLDAGSNKIEKGARMGEIDLFAISCLKFFHPAWAKDFLLPIVLAVLICFLLAPVVTELEKFGSHPVLAVLSTVAIAFGVLAAILATVLLQTGRLASHSVT
jgi:hypothetical protein